MPARLRIDVEGSEPIYVDLAIPAVMQELRIKVQACLRDGCPVWFASLPGSGRQYCTNEGVGNCADKVARYRKKLRGAGQ
jgi:hypothetical protein